MTATQINLSEHEGVMYSGGYSKLGALGKDFQNWMFSKKNMAVISYFPFFSENHNNL